MDPQLSGFALGLLLGAAKAGLIGTLGFGVAWWRTRRKLRRLEAELPDPGLLSERLAAIDAAAAQVVNFARGGKGLRLIWAAVVLQQHRVHTWTHQDHRASVGFRFPVVQA